MCDYCETNYGDLLSKPETELLYCDLGDRSYVTLKPAGYVITSDGGYVYTKKEWAEVVHFFVYYLRVIIRMYE